MGVALWNARHGAIDGEWCESGTLPSDWQADP